MREVGDRDELMEIVARLRAVTGGCVAQELSLRRNPMGQLGFHVQPDGVVTQVESLGLAWQAGLRHGARLVEVRSPPPNYSSCIMMILSCTAKRGYASNARLRKLDEKRSP
jgi:hypothetical protein